MKIALASDLHLEFDDIELNNTDNAEVLILAGDILIAQPLHDHPDIGISYDSDTIKRMGRQQLLAMRFRKFLSYVSAQFPHVIYIAGNHEFYHGSFPASINHLREECSKYTNIYFMENDCRTINGYTFIGSTLWTDMNRGDPMTLHCIGDMMNDYRIVRNSDHGYTKLRPAHTMNHHRNSLDYIKHVVKEKSDENIIVVSHMAPTMLSIHERYRNSTLMNGGYASDLSEFILDHPQIKLWCHGHVHNSFDYMMGDTKVLCNPRGYHGHDMNAETFNVMFLDI